MRGASTLWIAGLLLMVASSSGAEDAPNWALFRNRETGDLWAGRSAWPQTEAPAACALRYVGEHATELGVSPSEIYLEDTRAVGGLVHVFFGQRHGGLPVEGAQLRFTLSARGELLLFTARVAPGLRLAAFTPRIPLERAREIAAVALAAEAGTPPERIAWHAQALVIVPAVLSDAAEDRLAWRLRGTTRAPLGAWQLLVDAFDGEILERRSLLFTATAERLSGEVRGEIRAPTPWGAAQDAGFPDLAVAAIAGATTLAAGFTDSSGAFDLGAVAAPGVQLRATLEGRFARIHEAALEVPPAVLLHPASAPPVLARWDSTATSPASLEAYVHVQQAHAALADLDPLFPRAEVPGAPWLDRPLPVVVNDPDGRCNAYALCIPEAPELHFLAGNDSCSNTARIADVVCHEYGHLITTYAYLPQWAPDYFHEGFADYFAATVQDTSLIGRDFFGPGSYLRNVDHDWTLSQMSPLCEENPYCRGVLLAGALWDLRAALIETLDDRRAAVRLADSLFHYSRYAKPQDCRSLILEMLLLDDDNGDLSDGTPHLELITTSFARHELADFAVMIDHAPLADTEDTTAARPLTVTLDAIFPPFPGGARVAYSVDGGPFEDLVLSGSGFVFRGALPAQPAGRRVRYYFTAADAAGNTATLPAGAPEETFSYYVGRDRASPLVRHEPPSGAVAGQRSLWLSAALSDNSGAVDSAAAYVTIARGAATCTRTWRLSPKSSNAALDPRQPRLFEAEALLACEDALPGGLACGDRISYHLAVRDGAREVNTTRLPANGEISLDVARGRAWDLEEEPTEILATGDWEWGAAAGGPPPGPSGTGVFATELTGYHAPLRLSTLTLPASDLSGWQHAALEFASWHRTEPGYDGGQILASADGGRTWSLATPLGGYPGWIEIDEDGDGEYERTAPAFTGASGGWETVRVPLEEFAGDSLILRFDYISDWSVTDLGWYIDDLKLAEQWVLPPPEQLQASQGEDGRVALRWRPPSDSPAAASLAGYRIYRGLAPRDYAPEGLATLPAGARDFLDEGVANGTRYYYAARALWVETPAHGVTRESPPGNEALGYPYRAALDAPSAVERTLYGEERGELRVPIANQGSGLLQMAFHRADEADRWDDRRVLCDMRGAPGAFRLLRADPRDAPPPDLRDVSCSRINENLLFRVRMHGPLPDPLEAFTLWLYLDTDLSLRTGMPETDVGADCIVVMGAYAYRRWGVGSQILDARLAPLGHPSMEILHAGIDSLEVGVPLQTIGWPEDIACALRVETHGDNGHAETTDRLPDPPACDWLSVAPRGSAEPGVPFPLVLAYDLSGQPELRDEFAAKIFIASNDPGQPVFEIPLRIHLASPANGARFSFDPPRPTPFRGLTTLRLHVPAGASWQLDIADAGGRRIWGAAGRAGDAPGIQLLDWHGRRSSGALAESGVYYAIARSAGAELRRKLVLIR